MGKIKQVEIKCQVEERWIPTLLSFLKEMEYNGSIGHSTTMSFYCDGDGDFRPKFEFDTEFVEVGPRLKKNPNQGRDEIRIYDAG